MLIDGSFDSYSSYANVNLTYYKTKKTAYHVLISELESENKPEVAEQVAKFFNAKMDFLFFKVKDRLKAGFDLNSLDFNFDEFKEIFLIKELDNFPDFRDNDALKRRIVYVLACAKAAFRIHITS